MKKLILPTRFAAPPTISIQVGYPLLESSSSDKMLPSKIVQTMERFTNLPNPTPIFWSPKCIASLAHVPEPHGERSVCSSP
jgi:hypothetical protein